ncbi:unnamed protein product, partial [Timema podura]|nr:unnamed protein product [Timema podura]
MPGNESFSIEKNQQNPTGSNSKGSRESLSAPNESFVGDGVIPPHRQAEEYFFSRSTPPGFGPSRDKVAPFTTT